MSALSTNRLALVAVLALAGLALMQPAAAARELRVCSDPNNMPFSNDKGEGFENKLAELIADELDATVSYTWWAQRRGFIRNTLKARSCDLVMGVPAGYELVDTTEPYYRSTYVYVYRSDSGLDLHSMRDPRLQTLNIGVHLIGDDGANPPPAHALGSQDIVDNVTGFMIYGDYREANPPARLIDAVASGDVDVAAVWGPLGGYFAERATVPLRAVPITDTETFPLRFDFAIALGVRKGEDAFRDTLNGILERRRNDIRALLEDYNVPLVHKRAGGDQDREQAE